MRRDEGSIFKHADGKRWIARLRYTDTAGLRREKKRICISHARAKDEIASLRAEIANDAADRRTYRELDSFFRSQYVHAAKFVGGKKISGFRQDIKTLERYLDRALDYFGDRPLDAITYADLREYKRRIEAMPARGGQRSVSDTNHHLKRVRRILNIAVEQGWLTANPFERGGTLIVESFEVERTRILSVAEEQRLLKNCERWRQHLAPILIFAIETACRRGEIRKLRWSDINLAGRTIRIQATNTKTLKPRLVPISARLRDTLATLRANQLRPNSLVFGGADFKTSFNKACRDAELTDVHFHDLRHTAITRMLEKGISPPLVMKIAGHTQQKTFLRYVNQSEQSVYEIAIKLDQAA
mgnify:CR=1 FL=1